MRPTEPPPPKRIRKERSISTPSAELFVNESSFFNTQNSDAWVTRDMTEAHPYDFPFVKNLLLRAPLDTLSTTSVRQRGLRSVVEVVHRKYEDEYLREPIAPERACVNGAACQGMHVCAAENARFVLREFMLPSQDRQYRETGLFPEEVGLCLMCRRAEIARALINIKADGMGVKEDYVIQDFRNIVGVEGEYDLDDCIMSSSNMYQGLLDPVVLHMKNAYRLKIRENVRYFEQWRMKFPGKDPRFLAAGGRRTPPPPSSCPSGPSSTPTARSTRAGRATC